MIRNLAIVVGEQVDPGRLKAIQDKFPFVEWGVPLQKSEWTDEHRKWIVQANEAGLRMVAHVSGPVWIEQFFRGSSPAEIRGLRDFGRIQFNIGKSPQFKPANFYPDLLRAIGPSAIALNLGGLVPSPASFIFQVRGTRCPELDQLVKGILSSDREASYLFDARGRAFNPARWPAPPAIPCAVGYAGGITPSNIAQAVDFARDRLGDRICWLDLEGGAKDGNGHFDFARVEALCRVISSEIGMGNRE